MLRNTLLCAASAVVLAACSGAAQETPPPRLVETIVVGESEVGATSRYPATLRGDQRASLSFEVGGAVERINFEIGDRFRRGQVLASLNARQQQLASRAATAALREAEASFQEAKLDFDRKKRLEGTGAVSQSSIDAARRVMETTRARVAALKADSGRAIDTVADTRIIAPFSGEVTARRREPAEVVLPGEAILEVNSLSAGLEAVIFVPERDRSKFSVGREFTFIDDDGRELAARVTDADTAAGTGGVFEVVLAISAARSNGLVAGSRGEILATSSGENSIVIPMTAVRAGEAQSGTVMVVNKDDESLKARRVSLGALSDSGIVIIRGLKPGDRIVTRGVGLLRDGEIVRIANALAEQFNP
ncbi:MAG: efflux RND transporter periplasmic adaptor subunit [Pseudomonadota bacterium]